MSITKEELIEILARLEAKMDASEARIKEEIKKEIKEEIKEIKEEIKEDTNILIEYTLAQATFSDLRAKKNWRPPYRRNDRVSKV